MKWYIIEKVASTCTAGCSLLCHACNNCVHMFTCTCMDAIMHSTICKHVHLLCLHHPNDHESIDKSGESLPVDATEQTTVAARFSVAFMSYNCHKRNCTEKH